MPQRDDFETVAYFLLRTVPNNVIVIEPGNFIISANNEKGVQYNKRSKSGVI